MTAEFPEARLERAWEPARAAGALGNATPTELREHTAGFVSAVCRVLGVAEAEISGLCVDVGTGAGVPGALLAWLLPATSWRLIDSSERRCEYAEAAVRALGIGDRALVVHGRAEELGHDAKWRQRAGLCVARLLSSPAETAELLTPFVAPGGLAVVSTRSGAPDHWDDEMLAACGMSPVSLVDTAVGSFVCTSRVGELATNLPRRPAARRRRPLS